MLRSHTHIYKKIEKWKFQHGYNENKKIRKILRKYASFRNYVVEIREK